MTRNTTKDVDECDLELVITERGSTTRYKHTVHKEKEEYLLYYRRWTLTCIQSTTALKNKKCHLKILSQHLGQNYLIYYFLI